MTSSNNALRHYDWEHYEADFKPNSAYEIQEQELERILAALSLSFSPSSILEVGSGLGRVTRLLLKAWPLADFSAADIALASLAEAQRLAGGLVWEFHCSDGLQAPGALSAGFGINQASSNSNLPDPQFDLIVAIEVLMHIPPTEVSAAIANLCVAVSRPRREPPNASGRLSGYLLTCDWTEPLPGPANRPIRVQNYRHDYRRLFSIAGAEIISATRVGFQTIYLVQP